MISLELATELRDQGLAWTPAEGDRFVLPDRDLDGRVFTISEMVVEVRRSPVGDLIAFNGTTEWALDAIERADAVWLPREAQLREMLGPALLSLARLEEGWRCTVRLGQELIEVEAAQADEAYGWALLRVLRG
ncbi:MAG: pilus assembly protein CpaE [Nitriliruptoraceae bacterium]